MVANLDLDGGIAVEDHIHARSELDQADALTARDRVASFHVEHDAAGDQAGDLLEDYGLPFAFHGDDGLFVFIGGVRSHGVQELALLVANIADNAGNWRAVDVHIEDVEEDADAGLLLATGVDD
jgi:hypothetical protein